MISANRMGTEPAAAKKPSKYSRQTHGRPPYSDTGSRRTGCQRPQAMPMELPDIGQSSWSSLSRVSLFGPIFADGTPLSVCSLASSIGRSSAKIGRRDGHREVPAMGNEFVSLNEREG